MQSSLISDKGNKDWITHCKEYQFAPPKERGQVLDKGEKGGL
jgi:hypothetical protein